MYTCTNSYGRIGGVVNEFRTPSTTRPGVDRWRISARIDPLIIIYSRIECNSKISIIIRPQLTSAIDILDGKRRINLVLLWNPNEAWNNVPLGRFYGVTRAFISFGFGFTDNTDAKKHGLTFNGRFVIDFEVLQYLSKKKKTETDRV